LRVWQRNYHEHVVRTDRALELIRDYIRSNPDRWPEEPELRLPPEEFRSPAGSET
jgi:hypothetical protein